MPVSCEERVMAGLVVLLSEWFTTAFGDGRIFRRGIPSPLQLPGSTPCGWLCEGETLLDPEDEYVWSIAAPYIAVCVSPTQADQDMADSRAQSAVWTKLNEAKEILRGLLNVSSIDSLPVWIKPKGEAQRFLGEREAWLSYPLIIKFPTEVPQGTYDPEAG